MENVLVSNPEVNTDTIQPCHHEEADYRMLLHASHAYECGYRRIAIHATDTDVVVIAIAFVAKLTLSQVWLAFGHAQHFRYIATHVIAEVLRNTCSNGLLFLHAMSGCDTVSNFCGISKKTVGNVWRSMPEIWPVFERLSSPT